MLKNYYCLVAGLREYSLEGDHKGFDAPAIRDEIREGVCIRERCHVDLLYTYYDIENILHLHRKGLLHNTLGNFTREELEEEVKHPRRLPEFLRRVLEAYADPENPEYEDIDRTQALERSLFGAYYEACASSGCEFIRTWNEFDCNLRNVAAALTARRIGRPVAEVVVGDGYVANGVKRSSAADFGLRGELLCIDRVIAAVSEHDNLIDKEHRIDLIRWDISEEFTTFDYFNINRLLGYLVRVNIIHRWMELDRQRGEMMFRQLMDAFDGKQWVNHNSYELQDTSYQ